MTRRQFLNDLYRRLGPLSREEAEQHLTYYAEMLADRMEEGMTEEEAVASMEDVDTIARRILEDAGVELENAPEAALPRQNSRRIWKWALAAVVCLVMLPLLGVWGLFIFNISRSGATSTELVDHAQQVTEFEVLYGTAAEEWNNGAFLSEEHVLAAADVQEIHIQWTAGAVQIFNGESADIVLSETAARPLDAAEEMICELRDGKLTVRFQRANSGDQEKTLLVQLPVGVVLDELEVETVSAAVEVYGGAARELELDSVSGDLVVEDVNGGFAEVSASTVSGLVYMLGDIPAVELESTSGNLTVTGNHTLRSLEVSTVSGLVWLSLPEDAAFTLRYETTSGVLDGGPFALRQSSGKNYSVGSGGARLEVESVSGDLLLTGE